MFKKITPPSKGIEDFLERKRQYERAMYESQIRQQQELIRKQKEEKPLEIEDPTNFSVQVNKNFTLSLSDRLAAIGMSGSGKTTFAKQLIPRIQTWWGVPIIILDTKGQGEFDELATTLHVSQTAPQFPVHGGVLVWKPPLDNLDEYNVFLERILRAHVPCFLLIDELSNLGRGNPDSYVPNYALLLKQGRGLKICILSMVQEVAAIPRQTTGQTSHLFRFHLLNDYDRIKTARLLGLSNVQKYLEPPYPFGFFYRRVDKPSPLYSYDNWQEFFNVA